MDWTDGTQFPWWVWLANTGAVCDVVNDVVVAVELEVSRCRKCVLVHSLWGDFRLSPHGGTGEMQIYPAPARYDR